MGGPAGGWHFNLENEPTEACTESEWIIRRTLGKAAFWNRHHHTDLNERQPKVLNRLMDAGPGGFEGGVSARKYEALAQTSKPTATRDLADLVRSGCLCPLAGGGRSTAYDIPWSNLLR
jgi:Fic family protein